MYPLFKYFALPTVVLSGLFLTACHHLPTNKTSDLSASAPTAKPKTALYISQPSHSDEDDFDLASYQTCQLEAHLIQNLLEKSQLSGINTEQTNTENSDKRPVLNLHIEHFLAAKSRVRFGSRQISSELTVSASLLTANRERTTTASCTTGLGVDPVGNTKACTRLQQCSEQISEDLLAWARGHGV